MNPLTIMTRLAVFRAQSKTLAAALAVGCLLSFNSQSQAQETVIFSDNFAGSSSESLGGKTTTTGDATWDGASDDAIKADGSFAGTGQKWLNWTPSSGYVYELKVTINQTSGNWAGLCFKPTAGAPIWAGFGDSGVGTMLDVNESWPNVGGIGDNGSGTYMIRLDTTGDNGSGGGWTTSYFFNGVKKGATHTWTTNPSIDGVGILTYGTTNTGSFDNFELKRTPVIYSDAFTGSSSSSLGGKTTTTGGGIWDGGSDDGIKADGSFSGTGQKWLNWAPSGGYVYELKVTINQTSGNWAGLCFKPTAGAPIWAGFGGGGVGTMLDVNESWPNVGGIGDNGSGTYMIRLDTTGDNGSGGGWTTSYFFNGAQKGATHTWTTNPSIDGVGIVTYGTTNNGFFSNFELKVQETSPVIYSDAFTGSGSNSLSGRAPTTGGGIWAGASEDGIKADGSFAGEGQKWLNWAPSSGYVYELKVTINQTSGIWAGLLFKPTAGNPIWAGFGDSGVGTMLDVNESWPNVGGIGDNGSGTYMIRLDTTAANWTTSYFFNGVQKGTTYTWGTNPSIDGVGIVTYGTTAGFFSNFELRYGASDPGPPTYASWATDNAGGQTADLDYDQDGVSNGVEYFMNSTPGFTANPALVGSTVTWPNGGNIPSSAYGSQFVVQTSTNLVNWLDVPGTGDANLANASASVAYTVSGSGKQFVRLKVTPSSPN